MKSLGTCAILAIALIASVARPTFGDTPAATAEVFGPPAPTPAAAFGNPNLVGRVIRISPVDVAAGYDVISVEPDETPRYIEVKSSTGERLRFEWSAGERRFAAEMGDRYWIYFVPLSDVLQDRSLPIFLIQNPVRWIERGALKEEPTSWRVTDPASSQLAADHPMSVRPLVELALVARRRK